MESKGLDGCDGILGLSPRDYGSRSILPSLKRQGLIDRIIISFSNAFHPATFKAKFYDDEESYVIFGGVNETQIVGGADGLFAMPLADPEMNEQNFWGVYGEGFLYGDEFFFNPEFEKPILAIIDSGTTLVMVPYKVYAGLMGSLAKKVKNDPTIAFHCSKEDKGNLGACWFNNTRCVDITDKLEPMRFIFGGIVFEIKIQAFLKDLHEDGASQDAPPEKPAPG